MMACGDSMNLEFPVNVLLWPPLQLLPEDMAPSARVNLADYIRDDPKSGNHCDDWGYIFNEKIYAGCDRKTQEKLVEHIQLSCNEQGFSMTVHTWANKEERGTLRIRLKCSHNRRTKCKFSFQLCYGLTEAFWYLRRGSGKHIHSGHSIDQSKILLSTTPSGSLTTQQKREQQAAAVAEGRSVTPIRMAGEKRSTSSSSLPSGAAAKQPKVNPIFAERPYYLPGGAQPPQGLRDYTQNPHMYPGGDRGHHENPPIGPGDRRFSRNPDSAYRSHETDTRRATFGSLDDHTLLAARDHSLLSAMAHSIDEREAAESLLFAGGRSPPPTPPPYVVSKNSGHERHMSLEPPPYTVSKNPMHERHVSEPPPYTVSKNPMHERHMSQESLSRINRFHAMNSQARAHNTEQGMDFRSNRDQLSIDDQDRLSDGNSLGPPPPRRPYYLTEMSGERASGSSRQTSSDTGSLSRDPAPGNRSVLPGEQPPDFKAKKEDFSSAAMLLTSSASLNLAMEELPGILESTTSLPAVRAPGAQQQSGDSGTNTPASRKTEVGAYNGFSENRSLPKEGTYLEASGAGRSDTDEINTPDDVTARISEQRPNPRYGPGLYRASSETRRDEGAAGGFQSEHAPEQKYAYVPTRGGAEMATRRDERLADYGRELHYSSVVPQGPLEYRRDDRVSIGGVTDPHLEAHYARGSFESRNSHQRYEEIGLSDHAQEQHYAPAPTRATLKARIDGRRPESAGHPVDRIPATARGPSGSRGDDRLPEHGAHLVHPGETQYAHGLARSSLQSGDSEGGSTVDRNHSHPTIPDRMQGQPYTPIPDHATTGPLHSLTTDRNSLDAHREAQRREGGLLTDHAAAPGYPSSQRATLERMGDKRSEDGWKWNGGTLDSRLDAHRREGGHLADHTAAPRYPFSAQRSALERMGDERNGSGSGILADHTSAPPLIKPTRDKSARGSFYSSIDTFQFSSAGTFNDSAEDLEELEGFGRGPSDNKEASKKGQEDGKNTSRKSPSEECSETVEL